MAGERIRILQRRWCSVRGQSAPHSSVVEGDELRPWANTGKRGFIDEWEQTRVVEAVVVEPDSKSRDAVVTRLTAAIEFIDELRRQPLGDYRFALSELNGSTRELNCLVHCIERLIEQGKIDEFGERK